MFEEDTKPLINYHVPSFDAIQQRKSFYTSTKLSDETVLEWYERIENVGNKCQFNHFHDFMVLDKFVCGLDDGILERLSEGIVLSLQEIFALATSFSLENEESLYQTDFGPPDEDVNYASDNLIETLKFDESSESDELPDPTPPAVSAKAKPKKEPVIMQDGKYICSDCGKSYKSRESFRFHRRIHTGQNLHPCSNCGKIFTRRPKLIRHMTCHMYEGMDFECYVCSQKFKHPSNVRAHLTVQHKLRDAVTYRCQHCDKVYLNPQTYRAHVRIHTGQTKLIPCKICNKKFGNAQNHLDHMTTHTQTKRYTCETCGKSFVRSKQLTIHFRTHSNERPYICKLCPKTFRSGQVYKAHARMHSGERPYKCGICSKGFVQLTNMRKHERTHNNERPYGCSMCEKRFATNYHRRLHMSVHTGAKPYKCDICAKSYTQPGTLRMHQTKVHTSVGA